MLNVSTATKNTYIQSESLHKELSIKLTPKSGSSVTVGNDAIVAEQFELEQHLCDAEVDFVGCVSSTCKFTLWNVFGNYDVGTKVEVSVLADNVADNIKIFTGYVNEVEANFENGEVEYICYDLIGYDYLSNWKFGDTLSSYLAEHRTITVSDVLSLMEQRSYQYHLQIVYDELPNDIRIWDDEQTGLVDTFKGMNALDILKYICQLQGMFGVINNLGQFEIRKINPDGDYEGAYPGLETFPSTELYPGVQNAGQTGEFLLLPYETFESSSRLTKREPPVNGIWIIETEDVNADKSADNRRDVKNYSDYIGGDQQTGTPFTGSVLKIIGNPFIHDKSSDTKLNIANAIQSVAGGYTYYPFEAKGKGLPFIEVGDYVDYIVTDWNESGNNHHKMVSCLILGRVLKGIQHMTDTYSAKIVDDWKSEESIHYITALPACTNVTDAIKDEDYDTNIEDIVDEKIEDLPANVWSVVSTDSYPTDPQPNTIYLIQGIVVMHGMSESESDSEPTGDYSNEG